MKRLGIEFLFSVVTALVATLVVLLIQGFKHADTSAGLILLIVAVAVLAINYQHEIILFARDRGSWEVPERLNSKWSFQTPSGYVTIEDHITVKVIGSYISGYGVSGNVTGDIDLKAFRYKLKGEIKAEGIIEGLWWTSLPGRNFSGTFQMRLLRGSEDSGRHIIADGKWTGVSRREGIRAGEWIWYAPAY